MKIPHEMGAHSAKVFYRIRQFRRFVLLVPVLGHLDKTWNLKDYCRVFVVRELRMK